MADDTDDRRQCEGEDDCVGFEPGDEVGNLLQHGLEYTGNRAEKWEQEAGVRVVRLARFLTI